jgi:hypothetical protein
MNLFSPSKPPTAAQREFHKAMMDIYYRASAESPLLGFTASFFGAEIMEYGGLETARRCIHSDAVGAGFIALYKVNRLDLTLEALIHDNPKWHSLFSEEELAICTTRLKAYHYDRIVE